MASAVPRGQSTYTAESIRTGIVALQKNESKSTRKEKWRVYGPVYGVRREQCELLLRVFLHIAKTETQTPL